MILKPNVRSSAVETWFKAVNFNEILLCLYTNVFGWIDANDITRRFDEHQYDLNKTCFTYKRRPVELIFHQEFNDVVQAISFEKKIKKWSGKKKLALANGEYDLLQILAECRNATHSDFKPIDTDKGLDCARPDKP